MPLLERRLLVVTGKGGVGKSTVTAALALAAVARGKRVLVCEVNTQERVSALLGLPPVGPEITRLLPGLDAVMLRPDVAMREYGVLKLRYRAVATALFENRLTARFLRFVPSLPELVMLGKTLHHVRQAKWDLVLLDAPATGHGITFLRVPRAVIETVPAGPMRSDALWMQEMLSDPAWTAVNLVALPEELPVNETIELSAVVHGELGLPRGVIFLNRFLEHRFSPTERATLASIFAPPILAAAARAAELEALRSSRGAVALDRLSSLGLPLVLLPSLGGPFDRAAIETLARAADDGLRRPRGAA